ncbi:hypothetical protein THSYN_30900 (plasmid) [Candidatus Thiodictyon syntrophicum]|uniref:DUF4010 domain-containing protein n=2 Tax=Candidatus Thiodictyon syntrophicum TaxID=1166950 RepID=A0A2K8UIE8_9GAMM|nr:hypothetical protein THSYN_30900 [Candidatus Thiodictyon syntrophicum]
MPWTPLPTRLAIPGRPQQTARSGRRRRRGRYALECRLIPAARASPRLWYHSLRGRAKQVFLILRVPAMSPAQATFYQWWTLGDAQGAAATGLTNPLELSAAIGFGAFLALVMVLAKGVEIWLGQVGVLALAAASGIADVDAITLSLAGMARTGLDRQTVVTGIVIAAATNSLVKGGMATTISGGRLGASVALPLAVAAVVGPVAVWITSW